MGKRRQKEVSRSFKGWASAGPRVTGKSQSVEFEMKGLNGFGGLGQMGILEIYLKTTSACHETSLYIFLDPLP